MSIKSEIEFSIKLLNILDPCNKSTVFSPASILNALAMLYAGCDGTTEAQLGKIIGENDNAKDILEHYSNFGKYCQATNNNLVYKLLFSNRLFLTNEPMLPDFMKIMVEMFDSQFEQVDFSKKAIAAEKINKYVSEKTEKLIKNLVTEEDIDDDINIFIVNALCFLAEWETKFDNPLMGKFYSSSSIREIEMMECEAVGLSWNLTKGENWKCLGIPYKTRNSWLHILISDNNEGLTLLLKKLSYSFIKKCIERKAADFINATIPAMKIEADIELSEMMKALGLTELFSGHGITKLFERCHYLDKAIHKAGIKLDQYGTIGYAASAMSAYPEANFDCEKFVADHPFLYFVTLVEDENPEKLKSILLLGTFN